MRYFANYFCDIYEDVGARYYQDSIVTEFDDFLKEIDNEE